MWTLFSSLFSLTLDYIFFFPVSSSSLATAEQQRKHEEGEAEKKGRPNVTALLQMHRTEVLTPGIPRRGVCASDHVLIGAEFQL